VTTRQGWWLFALFTVAVALALTLLAPAPAERDTTKFGASVYAGSQSWAAAARRSNERYGGLEAVRVFHPGLPAAWDSVTDAVDSALVVSFKADPAEILSGADDVALRRWFAAAPRDRDVWWTYFHEPEDDVERDEFTAEAWRAAYRHVATLADAADNPRLHNTVVLMCWTLEQRSGRSFSDFFPGEDVVEAMGWDCYSKASDARPYADPEDLYGTAIAKSRDLGLDWGIAETASLLAPEDTTGTLRADWLREMGQYLSEEGASFVLYFDSPIGGEFRLLDEPSQQAWRDVIARY
jgi:hypothetical protein